MSDNFATFQVTLFKLVCTGSDQDEVNNILHYDFRQAIDNKNTPVSLSPDYWRNLLTKTDGTYLSNEDYLAYYKKRVDSLLTTVAGNTYGFQGKNHTQTGNTGNYTVYDGIDLSEYFISFTSSITLNNITETAELILKEHEIVIEENDLIEIKENGALLFLGFATQKSTDLSYPAFYEQHITLLNIGKMFTKSKITYNPSFATYAIDGSDVKNVDQIVFDDIFNNKNVFEIIDFLMTYFFLCKSKTGAIGDVQYAFDNTKIGNLAKANQGAFNIIFPLIKALQLYQAMNPTFFLCSISNGNHLAYNTAIKKNFQNYKPQVKSAEEVLKDVMSFSLYDMFVDYNGSLTVRPPMYNYLPMGFNTNYDNGQKVFNFNTNQFNNTTNNNMFVIQNNNVLNYNFSEDNSSLEIRTDALYSWNFYGQISEAIAKPQFFEDIPGLIKYGFSNAATKNNPNSMSDKMARTLAMLYNHQVNNKSRNLTVTLKTDKGLSSLRYQIGRLYYLDLSRINSKEYINTTTGNNSTVSPNGVVGYLANITKEYAYGKYIVYDLSFIFVRDMSLVSLQGSASQIDQILWDFYNIVNPYGVASLQQTKKIDSQTYLKFKNTQLSNLKAALKLNNNPNIVLPMFKTMPTVLDLIELTYADSDTITSINEVLSSEPTTSSLDSVEIDNGYLSYKSYKFKSQRFFGLSPMNSNSTNNAMNSSNNTGLSYSPEMFTLNGSYYLTTTMGIFDKDNLGKDLFDPIYKRIYDSITNSTVSATVAGSPASFILPQYLPTNYQKKQFQIFNNTAGYDENSNGDNFLPTKFQTKFKQMSYNNINLGKISQKLFNRIMEAEAEIWDTWGQDMVGDLFYSNDIITTPPILWQNVQENPTAPLYADLIKSIQKGNVCAMPPAVFAKLPSADSLIGNDVGNSISKLFNPMTFQLNNMPLGNILDITQGGLAQNMIAQGSKNEMVFVEDLITGDWYNNPNFPYNGWTWNGNNNIAVFSPGFLFNLATILYYNVAVVYPTSDDLNNWKKLGIAENSDEVKSHKDGRAIDFILPCQTGVNGAWPMPFVYPYLLGNYSIAASALNQFDAILGKYFDKVTKTPNIIRFDMNKMQGITSTTSNMQSYAVYVYHIEVIDKDYLNPQTEVLQVSPHSNFAG